MLRLPLILLLAFTCLTQAAEAGNAWKQTTLHGNCCDSFVFHPVDRNLVYGTAGDLWISRNEGLSWKRLYLMNLPFVPRESNFEGFFVRIHPRIPSKIFVVFRGVLMSSRDQGATWRKIADIPFSHMTDFDLDPQDADTMFAGGFSPADHNLVSFVQRSLDGGRTWKEVFQVRSPGRRVSVEMDPANHLRVYALEASGLWLSTDGGDTWAPFGTNVRKGGHHLTVDRRNPRNLYALFGSPFKSTDSGASWEDLSCDCYATAISIDPADSNAVYMTAVGLALKSTDAGQTWTSLRPPPVSGFSPWNIAANAGIVLLRELYDGAVFRSADSGASWKIVTNGAGGEVRQLAAAGPSGVLALGSTLFKTTDAGRQWTALNREFPGSEFSIGFLDVSPVNPGRIAIVGYARYDNSGTYRLGVSPNGGQSWDFQKTGGVPVTAVFDPLDANSLFLLFDRKILKTSDLGRTWQTVAERFSHQRLATMAVDPVNPGIFYAGSLKYRVHKTSDGGRTWTFRTLSNQRQPATSISRIEIDRRNSHVLYAVADFVGLFKSTDAGLNWKAINTGLPLRDEDGNSTSLSLTFLTLDPFDSNTLYTGGHANMDLEPQPPLFVSHDAGAHWSPYREVSGLPTGFFPVLDLVFGAPNSKSQFLSSYTGVYSRNTEP